MWSDALLAAEREHLLRLFAWAALSVLAGTGVLALLAVRRVRSDLLTHFAIQMTAWGVLCGLIGYAGWTGLHLRDVSGAARLERLVWLNIGLDAGYVAVGATLALTGRALGRRMSLVGAGTAVMVQGLALLLLDLHFAALVSR